MKKKIREFIWPLLDELEEIKPRQIGEEDCKFDDDEIDLMLKYIEKYSDSEDKRIAQVESKATIFIGIFGVVITVLLNLIKSILTQESQSFNTSIISTILILAVVYLCRAIWFAIKALERRNYHKLGFPNFMLENCSNKKKKILINEYNNIKNNQLEINIKVDYMTMAQEYFKRAIIVVVGFSIIILINQVVFKYINIFTFIKNININWWIGILLILIVGIYILVFYILKKIKSLNNKKS
ncbi:hypothetical protein OQL12_002144 [Clostridium perfringens]|nr:hypothetical protein [Clostridium perfringens]MDU6016433.1 hypothetical protein [Clostridium perfringens]